MVDDADDRKRWIVSARRAAIDPLDGPGLTQLLAEERLTVVEAVDPATGRPRAIIEADIGRIERLRTLYADRLLISQDGTLNLYPSEPRATAPFPDIDAPDARTSPGGGSRRASDEDQEP